MISLDIETTGLYPDTHDMVSIGAVHMESGETFYKENKVKPNASYSKKALEINGFSTIDIFETDKLTAIENLLCLFNWVETHVPKEQRMLVGWNLSSFDVQFLKWYYRNNKFNMPKWKFGHRYVDLHSCLFLLTGCSYSSVEACNLLDVEREPEPHNALEGAYMAQRLWNEMRNRVTDHGTQGIGDSILTYTGKMFSFRNPRPDQICLEDIAQGISGTFRFNGQSHELLTVAQHSENVAGILWEDEHPKDVVLEGLLHDATEAYLSDIAGPAKIFLPDYQNLEKKVARAITKKFGIDIENISEPVKDADRICLYYEAKKLFPKEFVDWTDKPDTHEFLDRLEKRNDGFPIMSPKQSKNSWMKAWDRVQTLP